MPGRQLLERNPVFNEIAPRTPRIKGVCHCIQSTALYRHLIFSMVNGLLAIKCQFSQSKDDGIARFYVELSCQTRFSVNRDLLVLWQLHHLQHRCTRGILSDSNRIP